MAYPPAQLFYLWDGASSHRGEDMQKFLAQANADLPEDDWQVTCLRFAPTAPEQNPTEDGWLTGQTQVRKPPVLNKTFAQVKHCFSTFLTSLRLPSTKLSWYWPTEQMISDIYRYSYRDLEGLSF